MQSFEGMIFAAAGDAGDDLAAGAAFATRCATAARNKARNEGGRKCLL